MILERIWATTHQDVIPFHFTITDKEKTLGFKTPNDVFFHSVTKWAA
jgi:hypothetical protein